MNKYIALFTEQPSGKVAESKKWKCVAILTCIAVLSFHLTHIPYHPEKNLTYHSGLLTTVSTFHFLAFYIKFNLFFTVFIRIVTVLLWILCGIFYMFMFLNLILGVQ